MPKSASLTRYQGAAGRHAVVISHGITQSGSDLASFAGLLAAAAPTLDLYLFDYAWTQPIIDSGVQLAEELQMLQGYAAISLVGYSMGGLVSRVAAASSPLRQLQTVITLATPNAGAVSTAQLAIAAQAALATTRRIAALVPVDGLMDLTRADTLMRTLRDEPGVAELVAGKRYASIPALFYHEHRKAWELGSTVMRFAGGAFGVLNSLPFSLRMGRPHDGIVTERSCNIADQTTAPYSEIDHTRGARPDPARIHARHLHAEECDHVSVLAHASIAKMVSDLLIVSDWSQLVEDADRRYLR